MKPINQVRFLFALTAVAALFLVPITAAFPYPSTPWRRAKSVPTATPPPAHRAENNNYRGLFYKGNNYTFAGFDDAAEAKKAGVAIGPDAAPPPNSFKPKAAETPAPAAPVPGANLNKPLSDDQAWRFCSSPAAARRR